MAGEAEGRGMVEPRHSGQVGEGSVLHITSSAPATAQAQFSLTLFHSSTTSCLGCELLEVRGSSWLIFLACKSSCHGGRLWNYWLVGGQATYFKNFYQS